MGGRGGPPAPSSAEGGGCHCVVAVTCPVELCCRLFFHLSLLTFSFPCAITMTYLFIYLFISLLFLHKAVCLCELVHVLRQQRGNDRVS